MEQNSPNDPNVLTEIISSLNKLSKDNQKRTLQAVATFLNISMQGSHGLSSVSESASSKLTAVNYPASATTFSEDRSISPKDFMRDKAPKTDVERVTCLAYYLTHYRDTPHFKTLDISTLNTEAAQPKLSNASVSTDNAMKAGLLVQAVKGSKQISAAGERYVQHLPDRDAAKSGIQGIRQKRKPRKSQNKNRKSTKQ